MLTSRKLELRRSEIRQELAELAANDNLTEEQRGRMDSLDGEYRDAERRFRAALISEEEERREAGAELETRTDRERAELFSRFELRQAALFLNEGKPFSGATAEVVEEMRSGGSYRGVPIPLEAIAMETRAGETLADGTPNPIATAPIVDRLFAATVASQAGVATINVPQGEREIPVSTSGVTAGWADGELGNVPGPQPFTTVDKSLRPDHTFGVQSKVSRRALLQSGTGLEAAMRRDLSSAIQVGLDRAVFQGSGANGEPLGLVPGAATYGIGTTAVDAPATWGAFRAAVVDFITRNAARGAGEVRALIRPETWDSMDAQPWDAGSGVTEYDRLARALGGVTASHNALEAPAGDPLAAMAILTTSAGGLPPAFLAIWGGVDLIRDPFTDAASGALRLTGLVTADVTVARGSQLQILTGLQ